MSFKIQIYAYLQHIRKYSKTNISNWKYKCKKFKTLKCISKPKEGIFIR